MHEVAFSKENFRAVGINYEPTVLGEGYLKTVPEDFLVEELGEDNSWCRLDDSLTNTITTPEGSQTCLRVIKKQLSTFAAIKLVAEHLNLDSRAIGYAGLKDERAVTAQRFSVPTTHATFVSLPNLKAIPEGPLSGPLRIGQLAGNRFIIHIRSLGLPERELTTKLTDLQSHGFPNFFSLQRFGPRLNNHIVGRAILTGDFELATRLILTDTGPETEVYYSLRKKIAGILPDWRAAMELIQPHREIMRDETKLLAHLISCPQDFAGALEAIPDSTRFYTSAYASFCFNNALSQIIMNDDAPETLPLFHSDPEISSYYSQLLPEEPLSAISWTNRLRCLATPARTDVPVRIKPVVYQAYRTSAGEAFYFDLPKGAYATTFLSELYSLRETTELPAYISTDTIDTLSLFDRGPLPF